MSDGVICHSTEKNDSMRSTYFLHFEEGKKKKQMGKSEVVNEMTLALFDSAGNSRPMRNRERGGWGGGLLAVEKC